MPGGEVQVRKNVAVAVGAFLIGAGSASNATAQALPPAVAQPTGEWRECVVRGVTSPHADATSPSRLLNAIMQQSCSAERNRTQIALQASGLETVAFEHIEDYVRDAAERALRARRASPQGRPGAPAESR